MFEIIKIVISLITSCAFLLIGNQPPTIAVVTRRPPGSGVFDETSSVHITNGTTPSPSTTETHSDDGFILIQSTQEAMEPSNRLDPIPNGQYMHSTGVSRLDLCLILLFSSLLTKMLLLIAYL